MYDTYTCKVRRNCILISVQDYKIMYPNFESSLCHAKWLTLAIKEILICIYKGIII